MNFLVGFGLVIVGTYLLMERVTVQGGYFGFFGSYGASFGITMLPVMFGIGMLFYDGSSILGRLLFFGGLLVIFAGILANMNIYFRSTSLFDTLMIVGVIAAGVGLVLRSLRSVAEVSDRLGLMSLLP